MASWATPEFARRHWKDASLDDATLADLLSAATDQCMAYAPTLATAPTTRHQLAVVFQAREIHTAQQRDSSDVIGVGDYAIRARPLTAQVKSLLRPQTRLGAVG